MTNNRTEALAEFRALCAAMPALPDDASHVHLHMIEAMMEAGYRTFHEYVVDLPTGRTGRIDIVAQAKNGVWLAIEIDARKPRRRSVEKLAVRDWLRICCLRGVDEGLAEYPGLDAVIALPVRLASWPEKARKAHIRRAGREHPESAG